MILASFADTYRWNQKFTHTNNTQYLLFSLSDMKSDYICCFSCLPKLFLFHGKIMTKKFFERIFFNVSGCQTTQLHFSLSLLLWCCSPAHRSLLWPWCVPSHPKSCGLGQLIRGRVIYKMIVFSCQIYQYLIRLKLWLVHTHFLNHTRVLHFYTKICTRSHTRLRSGGQRVLDLSKLITLVPIIKF